MSDCHDHDNCQTGNSSVFQTLDELEFERGIWYAAQNNDLDRVKKLLRQGVLPDVQDKAGYTALHYAARNGHIEVCRYLIDFGAFLDPKTKAGEATPLHRAVSARQEQITKLLMDSGAEVTAVDADGKTVLHRAVEGGSIPIIRSVMKAFPPLKMIMDNKGKLPIQYAGDSKEIQALFD